jgi:hypothetical protein
VGEVGGAVAGGGAHGWGAFAQEFEHVPELRWPQSVHVYDRMLTDSQAWSLYAGTALPLLDYAWWIEPGDADPEAAQLLADDLGLPLGAPDPAETYDPPGPGAYRFNFLEHLSEALLALVFGHYYFEQVGEVDAAGWWRLRKLAPRAPQTIEHFEVAPDGGLRWIRQSGVLTGSRGGVLMAGPVPPIPVDRLVGYVWQGDSQRRWTGRSMFRSIFREWLVKDRLIRVDAINHDRAGGVPHVETDEDYQGSLSLDELAQLAMDFRVGEEGGAALPPGAHLKLLRAGGTDVIGSIRYMDEAMARAWQDMVAQLGQTQTGSRALGGTFDAIHSRVRRAIARWFATTFREHVVEDYFAWNVGEGAGAPSLACRPPQSEQAASAPPPAAPGPPPPAPGGGGPPTPAATPPSPQPPAGTTAAAPTSPSRTVRAGSRLPDRPLRRQPYDHEVRAATDFAALDVAFEDALLRVQRLWDARVLPEQVAALADALVFTKKGERRQRLTRLDASRIAAPVLGADELAELLLPAAREGAALAVAEAIEQGRVGLEVPSGERLAALVRDQARAVAEQGAHGMELSAQRRAAQVTGGGLSPSEVAEDVVAHLQGLKHQWTRDQLAGAVQAAQVAGRLETWRAVPEEEPVAFHASELLDGATCDPCAGVDGREYGSIAEAQRDYPSGGFRGCQGGPRCRGTVVAVFEELGEGAPVLAPG